MTIETLTKLKTTLSEVIYDDLVEYLSKQLRDLKNIDNIREMANAEDQAVEVKSQKKAYDKLEAILSTIIFVKTEPIPDKPKENDFGV